MLSYQMVDTSGTKFFILNEFVFLNEECVTISIDDESPPDRGNNGRLSGFLFTYIS